MIYSEKKIKNISLVIPCYNEKDEIGDTIVNAEHVLSSMILDSYEIIVVDDGSDDKSGEIASESNARVIFNPCNVGYGKSLKSGISEAKFDTIIIVDADGTYPLDQIPVLIGEYEKNFDLVVGARSGINYWESWQKNFLRKTLTFVVEFGAGTKIADINSGFRVFSKKTIIPYFENLSDVFSFTTSMTLAYTLTKRYISYIPIEYRQRVGKSKVRVVRDTLRTFQSIVQAMLCYNPVKTFLIIFFLTLALSVVFVLCGIVFENSIPIWIGSGGGFIAILIFAMGLMSYLISRKF